MEYLMKNKYHMSKMVQTVIFGDTEEDWVSISVLEKEKGVVHLATILKSELKRMGRSL
ncbi:hypothetical protein ES702_03912 [subsurface metagenome]